MKDNYGKGDNVDKKYYISNESVDLFQNCISVEGVFIHVNNLTVTKSQTSKGTTILLGDFMDCKETEKTKQKLCDECAETDTLSELLNRTKYLLGRFVCIKIEKSGQIIVISDAVGSIPIYHYKAGENFAIASDSYTIAQNYNLRRSEKAIKIKQSAAEQHPLPYNMTMYDEIGIVTPNHYLDGRANKMVRYYPSQKVDKWSFDKGAEETINVMEQVVARLVKEHNFSLPITAGVDSRALLALFKDHIKEIPLYTFYTEKTKGMQDIEVPKKITNALDLAYHPIEKKELPSDHLKQVEEELDFQQNENILRNAYTLHHSELRNTSFLAGDIIPIAKSNFGQNLSEKWVNATYLVTKTHNYSKENKKWVKKWMKDASNDYDVSLFDLFFWEQRLGRWLPNNAVNYDIYSDPFYIFNCRYLIELWLSIPREERVNRSLHKEMINRKWPELLEFPINPAKKTQKVVKQNQYLYYFGSIVKHYINRVR